MAKVRGCDIPEDLYYYFEKHTWAMPLDDGNVRVGVSTVAAKMAGELVAVTPRSRNIGKELAQGKSIGTMESSKYVGPIPTPVTGVLVKVNEALGDNPNLLVSAPYGEGWVAEFEVADWEAQKGGLLTGQAALDAYQALLEQEDISCE